MKALAVAAAFGFVTQVIASPFGLSQGLSIEDATKLGQFIPAESEYRYVAKSVTNGNADFDTYSILLTPKQGLCSVVAFSKEIYTNAYGHQLKSKFKELSNVLTEKYGYPRISLDISRTFDLSRNFGFWNLDGIWIEDDSWMDGLLSKKRNVSAIWEESNRGNQFADSVIHPKPPLPDSVERISLNALARTANKGYLRLEYRFNNYGACVEEVKLKRNANL